MNGRLRTTTFGSFLHLDEFTFWYGPIYFLLLAGAFFFLGISLFSGRLVSVILGIICLNIFYKITSNYNKKSISFILTILLGTFPYFFISSRQIRFEIAVSTFSLISFYLLFCKFFNNQEENDGNYTYLLISGVFSALALLSHPNGVIPIIFNSIGIIIYPIPLKFKSIFSKDLIKLLKKQFKPLILFGLSTILTCLPYTIFILKYNDAYQAQVNFHVTSSFLNFFNNYKGEYTRYVGIIIPYNESSYFIYFPKFVQIVLLLFLITLFIFGFFKILILSLETENKIPKILVIYILGIMFIFAFLVYNKTKMYLSILMPYIFLSVSYIFTENSKIPSNFHKLKLNYVKKIMNKKLIKAYKSIWIILLFTSQIMIIINSYEEYENTNPYYVRNVLENLSISKNETIMGDPTLYIALYEYKFIHYYPMYLRFLEGESFQDLIEEFDPDYILYDKIWQDYRNDENFMFYFNDFIQNECVIVLEFNSTISYMDPIIIYRVN